ncbi:NAD(P)/FAD-dependent oxidoreductase [Steroidobacter sp.]|uniref:NAD(P)/FAD-dependent oxidoreductase n=1 Tax=Steroidobacter sp. TaxID=1978227 RepID=UPI001A5CEEAD|nr:FAD-dependent oxidoreductase [Steroidobacter sp.]MBL8271514.1 FAD-dependent oxidoreductase [Steroidobacter sp.]
MSTETHTDPIYVVGGGHAGGEIAFALRQQGYTGPLTIIAEEGHLPYQRPPLSKAYLKGECEASSLYLRQQAAYEKANIDVLLSRRVERIDRAAKQLVLDDGRELKYSKLALATGGRARRMTIEAAARAERANNFHYLRSIDDVIAIRSRFESGKRLVVIGGGYVGLEVAASAITRDVNVTVLEALPRVLARVTAPQMSEFYERVHRNAGVDLRTNIEVTGLDFNEAGDAVTAVHCTGGVVIPADVVVVGIGLLPNTEVAQAAGLDVDNGIVVNEYAVTSDPDIVAAGDCTNHPSTFCGRRIRLESVPNAVEQARVAAASLAGKPKAYDSVPWFWSDQYDLKLQMTGLSQGYDQFVLRGSPDNKSFAAFYLKAGKLIACDAVNRAQEFMVAKRLVAACQAFDPAVLADESVPLKTLAPPVQAAAPQS